MLDMGYNVIDTWGNHSVGHHKTRDDALGAIRLYIVEKVMGEVGLFEQDFINLVEDGNVVIYENPIGYFPKKPTFLLEETPNWDERAIDMCGLR
jgi:hypothetical protein